MNKNVERLYNGLIKEKEKYQSELKKNSEYVLKDYLRRI